MSNSEYTNILSHIRFSPTYRSAASTHYRSDRKGDSIPLKKNETSKSEPVRYQNPNTSRTSHNMLLSPPIQGECEVCRDGQKPQDFPATDRDGSVNTPLNSKLRAELKRHYYREKEAIFAADIKYCWNSESWMCKVVGLISGFIIIRISRSFVISRRCCTENYPLKVQVPIYAQG